ncbi:zinc finger SWIM domain-containing protein 1 [Microcaecilia unicolor]|uniref:Zinc finger SWIM domain-containing protein 1 n=1 Tax=Microcaecilia unicolor TaxID=1415580 RepID=A0A6P7YWK8_9AMPH|nr:zinc finger SWIM domain-containing protein 1 [Microcaecilia unicolor]
MAGVSMHNLLGFDSGSLVAFQLDNTSKLDSLSFETSFMKTVFLNFPHVILVHRTRITKGRSLYAFLADSPGFRTIGEIEKVVHFAVPKDESKESLAQMYKTFKEFNPDWAKIKTFLVEPYFPGSPTLSEAFPSAEIVLSVFHVCKFFQQKIYQFSLNNQTERLLLNALKNTMCSATEGNLNKMHVILKEFIKPDLLPQLNSHWLLADHIWALHRWRTWAECIQYFQGLEIISRDFAQLFSTGVSLETSISSLAKHVQQRTDGKKPPEPGGLKDFIRKLENTHNDDSDRLAHKRVNPVSDSCPSSSIGLARSQGNEPPHPEESTVESEDQVQLSIVRICTPAAAKLCLQEFAVAQKSVQLVGTNNEKINIQILEDFQEVDRKSLKKCTCNFNQTFQLPCRHILAILNSDRKVVQSEMIHEQWNKRNKSSDNNKPLTDGLLEILKSSYSASQDKSLTIMSLKREITRLLVDCNNEEFERRYNTLRELADNWIGPYVQVKL